ncbi:MAG: hypothetical protein LBS29_04315 [Endomicrobium sp.]|jgi:DNA primase|nr:hypothetical protein [Endomicrobium sp.]
MKVYEYFTKFINPSINLVETSKICCPFHEEDTPSFSYKADTDRWRCFGACHFGGDIYALHQKNFRLKTRDEAISSLNKLLGIESSVSFKQEKGNVVDVNKVEIEGLIGKAINKVSTVEEYLELDYIMSYYPVDKDLLQIFITKF